MLGITKIFNQLINRESGLIPREIIVWFFLLIPRIILIAFSGKDPRHYILFAYDYFLISFFFLFVIRNLSNPKKILQLLLFILLSNIGGGWFTSFTLFDKSFRFLFFDLLLFGILFLLFIRLTQKKKIRPFFLSFLFLGFQIYWLKGFILGTMESGFGGAYGEARFYLCSILFFAIIYFFENRKDILIVIKTISLSSILIALAILLFILLEQGNYSAERYNPGNPIMTVMVWGLMITTFDYQNKTNLRAISVRPEFLIPLYLVFIILSGCRTMSIVALLFISYSFILSPKIKLKNKLGILVLFLLAGFIFSQTTPGQKIISEQTGYIEKSQDNSKTYGAKTTFEWRTMMWQAFLEHISNDNERILWGRGFKTEKINIEKVHWKWGEGQIKYVDSSMAHNDFIVILLSSGIVFTGLFVIIILMYLVKGFRYHRLPIQNETPLGELFSFFLIVLLFQSSFNATFKHFGFSMMIWVILGIMAHIFNLKPISTKQNDKTI